MTIRGVTAIRDSGKHGHCGDTIFVIITGLGQGGQIAVRIIIVSDEAILVYYTGSDKISAS